MANSKTVLLYKGRGAGTSLDLGGLSILYSLDNEKSKKSPAMAKRIRNFSRPTAQMIASAKETAKSLIDDFKEEKMAVATAFKVHGEIGNRSFELVY